ncbi:1,4-dihydroxy-2-naphthoate polyprenyltransferase [Mumia quercus]|uniref:1,4-dihydroxy-2-naphthoate polyprenyltransferase n=1 Tax=Mumia quercus TaxID=2976125 RepID=UPI0021CEAABE|nr:1,4-dihydroxy-2-naphthoate polyprenyltransferase [Mumia quercus]
MATASQWIAGARPRTLPAAVAPVVAGTGAALFADGAVWWKAVVCLLLSLALQVGVNYANDYSDGVKGTDDDRVGPMRLVGSGAASAGAVKRAAFACFGGGAALGLVLAATSGWWLLLVGVAAIAAAWFYTGGSRPYGYRALGEVSVFLFFGLVAVLGTTYVQVGAFTWPSLAASIGIGALACAILVANNLRDIPTDTVSGKRTLAVVLGDRGARVFFVVLLLVALVTVWWLASYTPAALFGLLAFPWALRAATPVARGERGLGLLPTLRDTGIAELVYAVGIAVGLALGA